MPFAFSQIQPRQEGQVSTVPVPLTDYLGAASEAGFADSSFASIYKYNELGIAKTGKPSIPGMLDFDVGPKVDPVELNKRYGIPGHLNFTEPTTIGAAAILNDRKMREMNRNFILGNGDTGLGRWGAGVGVSMISSMLNPIDLGSMFMPFVGSEEAAANAARLGQGAVRRGIARGLVTVEDLSNLPNPKFVASVINGAAFQGVAEVPSFLNKIREGENYDFSDFTRNVAMGGVFAGAMHVGIEGAARIFRRLRPETREAIVKRAMDDFVKGEDPRAAVLANIDENIDSLEHEVAGDPALESLKRPADDVAVKQHVADAVEEVKQQETVAEQRRIRSLTIEDATTGHRESQGEVPIIGGDAPLDVKIIDPSERTPTNDKIIASTDIHPDRPATASDIAHVEAQLRQLEAAVVQAPNDAAKIVLQMRVEQVRRNFDALRESNAKQVAEVGNARFGKLGIMRTAEEMAAEQGQRERSFAQSEIDREKSGTSPERQRELDQHIADGKIVTRDMRSLWTIPDNSEKASEAVIDESVKQLESEQEIKSKPSDRVKQLLDDAIKALETDHGKIMSDPFLVETLGKPLLRGLLQIIREAYLAGRDLERAIERGMTWLMEQRGAQDTPIGRVYEAVSVALNKNRPPSEFAYSIESELQKDMPFGMGPRGQTADFYRKKILTLAAPEQATLKLAGIDKFLKGKTNVDLNKFHDWTAKNLPRIEVRPMDDVSAGTEFTDLGRRNELQHKLESVGYTFDADGNLTKPSMEGADIPYEVLEKKYLKLNDKYKRAISAMTEAERNIFLNSDDEKLTGDNSYTAQNIAIPIDFTAMHEPKTIFLLAPQTPKVRSEHFTNVKFGKNNMLGWARTHVVELPDGRKALHVFEIQSDVDAKFYIEEGADHIQPRDSDIKKFMGYWLDDQGKPMSEVFDSKKDAQEFVDAKKLEFRDKVQPLINNTDELLLKSAVNNARERGLDGVIISDPRTAMLTQGHVGLSAEDWGGDATTKYESPSQAPGMTQMYGKSLPNTLKKITGKAGENVEMPGEHYITEAGHQIGDFNKEFPGSMSPTGQFFPVTQIDRGASLEAFGNRQVKIKEAVETAIDCVINKLL